MMDLINTETHKLIPENDQPAFLEDALEDLEHMDEIRMAGLGITVEQLQSWRILKKKDQLASST